MKKSASYLDADFFMTLLYFCLPNWLPIKKAAKPMISAGTIVWKLRILIPKLLIKT